MVYRYKVSNWLQQGVCVGVGAGVCMHMCTHTTLWYTGFRLLPKGFYQNRADVIKTGWVGDSGICI